MIRCPSCGAVCEAKEERCPSCGSTLISGKPIPDEEMLAKDRWSFTGAVQLEPRPPHKGGVEKPPERRADKTPASAPSSVGYEGQRGRQPRFDMTVGISSAAQREAPARPEKRDEQTPEKSAPQKTKALNVYRKPTPRQTDPQEKVPSHRRSKLGSTVMGVAQMDPARKTEPLPLSQERSGGGSLESARKPKAASPIESDSVRVESGEKRRATAPQQVKLELGPSRKRSEPPRKSSRSAPDARRRQQRDGSHPGWKAGTRLGAGPRTPRLSIGLGAAAAILISTWFIPNIWSANPSFAFQLIRFTQGADLIALLATPIFGALLLALLVAPLGTRSQAFIALPLSLGALAVPLLIGVPALPIEGTLALAVAAIGTGAAVLILSRAQNPTLGHIVLALVPGTLFGVAVFGVATGKLPPAQLSVFKTPLNIYAAMLIAALAAEELLPRP